MLGVCTAGTGTLHKVDGILEGYLRILQLHLKCADLGYNEKFQRDNDTKHTLEMVLERIKQANIKLLEWKSQNLDLNPVESRAEPARTKKPTTLNEL